MQDNHKKLVEYFSYGNARNPDMDGWNLILLARIADNLDRLAAIQEQEAASVSPNKKVAKQAGDGTITSK